jgi:hypothetical protein
MNPIRFRIIWKAIELIRRGATPNGTLALASLVFTLMLASLCTQGGSAHPVATLAAPTAPTRPSATVVWTYLLAETPVPSPTPQGDASTSSQIAPQECPNPGELKTLFWGSELEGWRVANTTKACRGINRVWSNRDGQWYGYNQLYVGANDDWRVRSEDQVFAGMPDVPSEVLDRIPPDHSVRQAFSADLIGVGHDQWYLLYAHDQYTWDDSHLAIFTLKAGVWALVETIRSRSLARPYLHMERVDGRSAIAFSGLFSMHGEHLMVFRWDGKSPVQSLDLYTDTTYLRFDDLDVDGNDEVIAGYITCSCGSGMLMRYALPWNGTAYKTATGLFPEVNAEIEQEHPEALECDSLVTRQPWLGACIHAGLAHINYLKGDVEAAEEACLAAGALDSDWRRNWARKVVVRWEGEEVPFCA